MRTWQHLKVLIWKNFIIWRRSCLVSFLEIALPIIMVIFLVFIRNVIDKQDFPQTSYVSQISQYTLNSSANFIPGKNIKPCKGSNVVGIVPNNPITQLFSSRIISAGMQVKFFNSTSEFDNYVSDIYYGTIQNPPLCFGVELLQPNPGKYEMHLRFNQSNSRTSDVYDTNLPIVDPIKTQLLTQLTNLNSKGFLSISNALTADILKSETGNNNVEIFSRINSVKTDKYFTDDLITILSGSLEVFLVLPFVLPFLRMVKAVLNEKEKKLREGMKMMGMSSTSFYLSWILHYMFVYLIISIVTSILLKRSIFPLSSGFLIWLLQYLFCLNLIMQALFITVFFTRSKVGILVGLVFFFIMFFVKQFAVGNADSLAPENVQLSASLSPAAAISLSGISILYMEGNNQGLSSDTMRIYVNNYKVETGFGMLFLTLIIFSTLFLYLDQVFPNEFGKKKHPLFFLPFLVPKKKTALAPKDEEIIPTLQNENNDICEQVDEGLRSQESNNEVLQTQNVCKKYSNGKVAVRDLSLTMYKNQIFALLGHNGAGKTTTISMLTGLLEITAGSAKAFGKDIKTEMEDIRHFLGVCPQHDILFDDLTVKEHLELFATFKGMPKSERKEAVRKMIENVDLVEKTNARSKTLSGGQKRRLSVGIALIGDSKLVLLDEPTSGMDTSARRYIWEMLKNNKQGRIIILTTHFMDEADYLGDRIAIMGEGILKCCGSSVFLKNKFGVGYNLIIVKKDQESNPKIKELIQSRIPESKFMSEISAEIAFQLPIDSIDKFKNLFEELDAKKDQLNVQTYGISITTLEEVFLRVAEGIDPTQHQHRNSTVKINEENEEQEFDLATIRVKSRLTLFAMHFWAIFMKRLKYYVRDYKGLIFELLIPFVLVNVGLGIVMLQTRQVPVPQKILPKNYANPINVYFALGAGANGNNLVNQMDPDFTMVSVPNVNNLQNLDDFLWNSRSRSNFGGFFMNQISSSTIQYDVLYNTIGPIYGPLLLTKVNEAFIRASTNKDIRITLFNDPMPNTYLQSKVENTIDSTQFVIVFGIGMAFLPASIIFFVVKERQLNVKHQHMISGVSLLAYWTSNYIVDIVKYLFTAILCCLMILAYNATLFSNSDVYGAIWALFILFGPAIVSVTYVMSFLFKDASSAQVVTFFANYFLGSLLAIINSVLFFISSTRGFAKNFPFFMNIWPSYAYLAGIVNIGSRDLFAQLEQYYIAKPALAPEISRYNVIYLGIFAVFYFILIFIIEFFIEVRGSFIVKANKEDISAKLLDSDVKEEIERIENESPENFTVRVNKARKIYRGGVKAVDMMSFGITNGECFGLLGINGAGKTTTFKMMTGDIIPSAGEIHIMGHNVISQMEKAREFIGYCPQFDSLLENLTCKEHLMLYGALKGIPLSHRIPLVNAKIKEMQLLKFENVLAGTLSGGTKRKLSVAIATLGNPPIIFLDEPSTGMDPEARRFMWTIISRISTLRKKSSVVLTTHAMEEAEALCSRMGIMVDGRFVCLGSIQHIKQKYGKGYEIEMKLIAVHREEIDEALTSAGLKRGMRFNRDEVNGALEKLKAAHLCQEIKMKGSGSSIYLEAGKESGCPAELLAEFVLIEGRGNIVMDFIAKNLGSFKVLEHFQTFYRFKITENVAISQMFGQFQENKDNLNIAQYSIRQATIEQIFNAFATNEIDTAQFVGRASVDDEAGNNFNARNVDGKERTGEQIEMGLLS